VNSYQISLIAFSIIFGCALLGFLLQSFIPRDHLTGDSKDAVKLGAGLLATMAALVLGLMVSSAKGTFDSVNLQISNGAAMDMHLEHVLKQYGPETAQIRSELRTSISNRLRDIWPEEMSDPKAQAAAGMDDRIQGTSLERMKSMIADLKPATLLQGKLQDTAFNILHEIERERYSVEALATGNLSMFLIFIPVVWIAALTLIYSTLAARNLTVVSVLFICSLSIAASIFLIFEMSTPLDGTIKVSSAPLRKMIKEIEN